MSFLPQQGQIVLCKTVGFGFERNILFVSSIAILVYSTEK